MIRFFTIFLFLAALSLLPVADAKEASVKKSPLKAVSAKTVPAKIPTVRERISEFGDTARNAMKPAFDTNGVSYPPKKMTWIALKKERVLLLFAQNKKGKLVQVLNYPILGTSGITGPKLKEGDKQIPEGFYRISGMRPKVIAHVGLDINYPNTEDKLHAKEARRKSLGGDIMIHGSYWSTGCLAMGNDAIEELFVLAYDTKYANINVLFAPCDLTTKKCDVDFKKQPKWLPALYGRLKKEMSKYPINESPGSKPKNNWERVGSIINQIR